jgi:hypothetical protein
MIRSVQANNYCTLEYATSLVISGTHVPLWALVLGIGAVFSVIAFFTTSNDQPPKFLMVL